MSQAFFSIWNSIRNWTFRGATKVFAILFAIGGFRPENQAFAIASGLCFIAIALYSKEESTPNKQEILMKDTDCEQIIEIKVKLTRQTVMN